MPEAVPGLRARLATPAKNLDNAPVRLSHAPGHQAAPFAESSTRIIKSHH